MAYNVKVYKGSHLLGSGSASSTNTISTFTVTSGVTVGPGRNVTVHAVGGNNIGASVNTRVTADGGTSLTLADAHPFS